MVEADHDLMLAMQALREKNLAKRKALLGSRSRSLHYLQSLRKRAHSRLRNQMKTMRKLAPDSDQHKRFIETARQLECDDDKERFEEKLKRIATTKPQGEVTKKLTTRR
jgi:hypothetical protein